MTLLIDIAEGYEFENEEHLADGEIVLFVIKKEDLDTITSELSDVLTECYIDAKKLEQLFIRFYRTQWG